MKVCFNTKYFPATNSTANVANYNCANLQKQNFESLPDVFVKSAPSFMGERSKIVRNDVIENGCYGIPSCLTLYLNPCTRAEGHRMPVHEDLDKCMEKFFPLCCASSSAYAHKDGYGVIYPNEEEFVRILQRLWCDSDGLCGADEEKYMDPEITCLKENRRIFYMRDFIREDFARALNVYSQYKYNEPVEDVNDVREIAIRIYNDDSIRTIKPQISRKNNAMMKQGKVSEYARELARQGSSGAMLSYLLDNKDKFFGPNKSIRTRFEEQNPDERKRQEIYGEYKEDNRSTFEKALDDALGWFW